MGFSLDDSQLGLLAAYQRWLIDEAIPAGGIGPAEGRRISTRHIADSLLFTWPFERIPAQMDDLGSGVGLPGIPLGILWPSASIRLVDRSGRRVELARRAVRVLDLDNVVVVQEDLLRMDTLPPAVVTRAAVPPESLSEVLHKTLPPGGIAVAGGSWTEPPTAPGWETVEIPAEMLDRRVWLLIMRRA